MYSQRNKVLNEFIFTSSQLQQFKFILSGDVCGYLVVPDQALLTPQRDQQQDRKVILD